ncbi:hypothetical protein [Pseudoxanthomonas mexicana]
MADDAKAEDFTTPLRTEFAATISKAVPGIPAHHALQLADTLCSIQADVLAGKRVTFRARPQIDGEAITEDWRKGMSLPEIRAKHGVSKPTAYKYHPNAKARQARAV